MLPTSRNRTYAASDKVRPYDLVSLEDMIRGMKIPTLTFPISAAAFRQTGGTGTLGDGQWTWVSGTLALHAGLKGDAGNVAVSKKVAPRRIVGVTWHYNRGGAGTMVFEVRERTAGGASSVIATNTDSATTGWTTATLLGPTSPWLMKSGYEYFTRITMNNAANLFGYALVSFDRLA